MSYIEKVYGPDWYVGMRFGVFRKHEYVLNDKLAMGFDIIDEKTLKLIEYF